MKFIENYCIAIKDNSNIFGYNAQSLFSNCTLYIVPMVNPDGVDLVTGNINSTNESYKAAKHIANNFPDIKFPDGWKANIKGVDLKNYQPMCKVL